MPFIQIPKKREIIKKTLEEEPYWKKVKRGNKEHDYDGDSETHRGEVTSTTNESTDDAVNKSVDNLILETLEPITFDDFMKHEGIPNDSQQFEIDKLRELCEKYTNFNLVNGVDLIRREYNLYLFKEQSLYQSASYNEKVKKLLSVVDRTLSYLQLFELLFHVSTLGTKSEHKLRYTDHASHTVRNNWYYIFDTNNGTVEFNDTMLELRERRGDKFGLLGTNSIEKYNYLPILNDSLSYSDYMTDKDYDIHQDRFQLEETQMRGNTYTCKDYSQKICNFDNYKSFIFKKDLKTVGNLFDVKLERFKCVPSKRITFYEFLKTFFSSLEIEEITKSNIVKNRLGELLGVISNYRKFMEETEPNKRKSFTGLDTNSSFFNGKSFTIDVFYENNTLLGGMIDSLYILGDTLMFKEMTFKNIVDYTETFSTLKSFNPTLIEYINEEDLFKQMSITTNRDNSFVNQQVTQPFPLKSVIYEQTLKICLNDNYNEEKSLPSLESLIPCNSLTILTMFSFEAKDVDGKVEASCIELSEISTEMLYLKGSKLSSEKKRFDKLVLRGSGIMKVLMSLFLTLRYFNSGALYDLSGAFMDQRGQTKYKYYHKYNTTAIENILKTMDSFYANLNSKEQSRITDEVISECDVLINDNSFGCDLADIDDYLIRHLISDYLCNDEDGSFKALKMLITSLAKHTISRTNLTQTIKIHGRQPFKAISFKEVCSFLNETALVVKEASISTNAPQSHIASRLFSTLFNLILITIVSSVHFTGVEVGLNRLSEGPLFVLFTEHQRNAIISLVNTVHKSNLSRDGYIDDESVSLDNNSFFKYDWMYKM
jgi:hypothetical protein